MVISCLHMLHLQSFRWATEWDSVRWTEYTTFMGLQSLEQALGQNKPSGTVDIMGIPKDTKDMDMCLLRTLMHTTEDTQVIITSSSPRSVSLGRNRRKEKRMRKRLLASRGEEAVAKIAEERSWRGLREEEIGGTGGAGKQNHEGGAGVGGGRRPTVIYWKCVKCNILLTSLWWRSAIYTIN
ncbi:hypothetical protein CRG98_043750 [Punica granatum]|uniref:Uncharacterized protein n=1 Tax=Punica granatum TaxID=22663 RepID=A0A2I0HVV9_PUNGR|nr:hypothetical protein CRG98_043750 [Punica granatum]